MSLLTATLVKRVLGGQAAGVRRADDGPAPIYWRAKPNPVSDLERNLRLLCDEYLAPELAQDVEFWLDLGRSPRDVARWLRGQLEEAPDAIQSRSSMPIDDSPYRQDAPAVRAMHGPESPEQPRAESAQPEAQTPDRSDTGSRRASKTYQNIRHRRSSELAFASAMIVFIGVPVVNSWRRGRR